MVLKEEEKKTRIISLVTTFYKFIKYNQFISQAKYITKFISFQLLYSFETRHHKHTSPANK
jgi:hypothetical protein